MDSEKLNYFKNNIQKCYPLLYFTDCNNNETAFSCNNGSPSCIPKWMHCDGVKDCEDQGDEDCQFMKIIGTGNVLGK